MIPPAGSSLARAVTAEFLGTAFLLAIVVGSGIMGSRLAGGNDAIALLANSLATGAGLVVLILVLGPLSGAHLNPAVTGLALLLRETDAPTAAAYGLAQLLGAVAGVLVAHGMFGEALLQVSTHVRPGAGQVLGEVVATAGLLGVIRSCAGSRPAAVPAAVGLYITAAYWFTSSTSFANPAVTLARSLTDTFAGIAPGSVPGFLAGQLLALVLVWLIVQRVARPVVRPGAA